MVSTCQRDLYSRLRAAILHRNRFGRPSASQVLPAKGDGALQMYPYLPFILRLQHIGIELHRYRSLIPVSLQSLQELGYRQVPVLG